MSPSISLVLQPYFVVPESPSFHCTAPHQRCFTKYKTMAEAKQSNLKNFTSPPLIAIKSKTYILLIVSKSGKFTISQFFAHPPPMRLVTQSHCQLLGVREPEIAHRQLQLLLSLLTAHKYASSLCPFFFARVGMSHRFKKEMIE